MEPKWPKIASLLQNRIDKYSEIPEKIAFLLHLGDYDTELYINKKNKSTLESSLEILGLSVECLSCVEQWTDEMLFDRLSALAEARQMKIGHLLWPVRIAVSGLMATPGGATDILYLVGKEESLRRIGRGIQMLERAIG